MLYLFFFLSGISALLYQVIWTHKLTLIFGVTTYAVSTTLSVFMLGLAMGSWYFGRIADSTKRPLLLYCFLEAGIAASAGASLLLLELMNAWIGHLGFSSSVSTGFAAVRMAGSFAVLIVPTLLMGGTLPVLAKVCVRSREHAGQKLGLLYAANTIGGVAGSFLSGFIFIPLMGMRNTLLQGVGVNVTVALLAYLIYKRNVLDAAPETGAAESSNVKSGDAKQDKDDPNPALTRAMLIAFFASGFLGLAGEVVWTRMALFSIDPSPQVFASILCVCLLGLAIGSLISANLADKYDTSQGYAVINILTGISVFVSILLWSHFGAGINAQKTFSWGVSHLPFEPSVSTRYMLFVLFESTLLLFLPCLYMGLSFPWAGRFFSRESASMGKQLGHAYMLNTLGSMLGPLICGFWWLPRLGIQSTVAILSLGYVMAGGTILASHKKIGAAAITAGIIFVLLALTFWFLPSQILAVFPQSGPVLSYEEDLSGSVMVVENRSSRKPCHQLLVGTTSMISDNFRCRRYTRMIGNIPVLLHPAPRKALVICLGSGMTLSAIASHPEIESIDCVDLSDGVVRAARTFFKEANGNVLDDPRVHLIVNDGRIHLLASGAQYDVICLEPPPPNNSGVANLYSREFYQLCDSHLNPGGMIAQWIPYHAASLPQSKSLVATIQSVFPTTTLWDIYDGYELCAVGHKDGGPIAFDGIARKLSAPQVKSQLDAVGIRSPEDLFSCFLMGPKKIKDFTAQAELVTDDLPGIGYDLEKFLHPGAEGFADQVQQAIQFTQSFAESPVSVLKFESSEARAAFEARLKPVKNAWLMHSHAMRITMMKSANADVLSELSQDFVAPTKLDPRNPYYQQALENGTYSAALNRFYAAYNQLGDKTRAAYFEKELSELMSKQ